MDLKLFIVLSRAMLYIDRKSDELFRKHDLTKGQFAVLEVLYHKGELTSKTIKEKILMSPGNLPVIIKNLERDGYIKKRKDPDDGRVQRISLTDKGLSKIKVVFPENEALIREMFSIWDSQEQKTLFKLLNQFRRHWYEEESRE